MSVGSLFKGATSYATKNQALYKGVLGQAGKNIAATPLSSYIKSSARGSAIGGLTGGIHSAIDDRGFWAGATTGAFQGAVGGLGTRAFIAGSYKAGAGSFASGKGNLYTAGKQYYRALGLGGSNAVVAGGGISKQVVALQRLGADVSKLGV